MTETDSIAHAHTYTQVGLCSLSDPQKHAHARFSLLAT